MIKSIYLSNFQSHGETTLKFVPGVNAIVGPSDSGKTAIIRAINWVVNNRPGGEGFRSKWGGDTGVYLEIDKVIVGRARATHNLYTISNNHHQIGPQEEFKAFGKGVPDEIAKELNMTPINLQAQMDPPFLLSESPGEVARYFNKVADLEVIDSSLASIASTLRTENQEHVGAHNMLKLQETELAAYAWLPEAEGLAQTLGTLESGLRDKDNRKAKLDLLITQGTITKHELQKYNEFLVDTGPIYEVLIRNHNAVKDKDAKRADLHCNIDHIKLAKKQLRETEWVKGLGRKVALLEEKVTVLFTKQMQAKDFDELIEQADKAIDEFEIIGKELANTQREFKKLMPKTCPLCGAPA